jgi:hypothetical protein
LFWHSHRESKLSNDDALPWFDFSFLRTYPVEAPSEDPHENYCWQKQKLDRSVSFAHDWLVERFAVSVFFLELLYQQARLDYLNKGDLFLWFFEKLASLVCELWKKPPNLKPVLPRQVFLRTWGIFLKKLY